MTNDEPNIRPSCEEILNRREKWSIKRDEIVVGGDLIDTLDSGMNREKSTAYYGGQL
jgi:hypothetical protein